VRPQKFSQADRVAPTLSCSFGIVFDWAAFVVSPANSPKGQIDSRAAGALLFFNSMFPTVLGVAFHQKKAARGEFQADTFQVSPGFVF
jgi:hypothetical protein